MMIQRLASLSILSLCLLSVTSQGDDTITRGNNLSVDVAADGRLIIDLAGDIWAIPAAGGDATRITNGLGSARRPRWSPDGLRVVYTVNAMQEQGLWVHDTTNQETLSISENSHFDLDPTWHPDGQRVTYASDRTGKGFDLWEVDLPTGLHWRLSSRPGDEMEPAWSADGKHLVYIHKTQDQWSLVLRRLGKREDILVSGTDRLAAPTWRPDGSLITFWRDGDDGTALDMVILSQPRLVRRYMDGEDYVTSPVSWLDKHRMFYSAGGVIRQRLFNAWSSRTVPFRATIDTAPAAVTERRRRTLPRGGEPQGILVIHAAKLFDGIGGGYQRDRDIVIEGGRIKSVEAHADRPGLIVIDMGDLTVLPGYIDAQALLPLTADETTGPLLLAAGVTTIVADHPEAEHLNTVWSGKEYPGPRILPAADWSVSGYSGLADSMTPGVQSLLQSRPARLIGFSDMIARRFSEPPSFDAGKTTVVLGSRPNGMPAGIALHAELRALVAAQLKPEQALRAAGVNAAAELGVDPTLGRLATGAVADLVFVDGDPLTDINAALNVVAVVRNGRFFSVAGLIDRAAAPETVE
jgi:Tol biopolymer transport system component